MDNKVMRKLLVGFIDIHILHHVKEEAVYSTWMIEELRKHDYEISAGTLYAILHNMEGDKLLDKEEVNVEGKIRKYYRITDKGETILNEARAKAYELFKEIR